MIFFLDMIPKVQAIKAKRDKWECIKPKSFGKAKEAINRGKKKQLMGWGKTFANHLSDKW